MLLQTFVQLNILLLAAPALAGWASLPAAHPLLAQAAQVAFLSTARQAAPQAAPVQRAAPHAAVTQPFAVAASLPDVDCPTGLAVATEPALARFNPFPHATRAP